MVRSDSNGQCSVEIAIILFIFGALILFSFHALFKSSEVILEKVQLSKDVR